MMNRWPILHKSEIEPTARSYQRFSTPCLQRDSVNLTATGIGGSPA